MVETPDRATRQSTTTALILAPTLRERPGFGIGANSALPISAASGSVTLISYDMSGVSILGILVLLFSKAAFAGSVWCLGEKPSVAAASIADVVPLLLFIENSRCRFGRCLMMWIVWGDLWASIINR